MPDIQITNRNKLTFLARSYHGELLHIANSNQYHIIFFNKDCECEVNFKACKVKSTQVLFLNASDVFRCETKGNTLSQFSFDSTIFNKEHCETLRLINGLLFDNLLNCNLLTFNVKELSKFESQFDKIMSFQNKDNFQNSNLLFKEVIVQAIAKKHKTIFL